MNLGNIKKGSRFKNYIALCKAIGIELAKGGRNLKLQKEELRRFFDWKTKGRTIIITKVYSEPKEKVDNRGKSKGSRNNNNTYMKHIDPILIHMFSKHKGKKIYRTVNQIVDEIGIINSTYKQAIYNEEQFYDIITKTKGISNHTAINNVLYSIRDILNRMIKLSLNRLSKGKVIEVEEGYILHEKNLHNKEYTDGVNMRLATSQEEKVIKKCEDMALKELEINKSSIFNDGRVRKEYYTKVEMLVFEEIEDIEMLYKGFEVNVSYKVKKQKDIETHKVELNRIIKERVERRNINRKKKLEEENKKLVFGIPQYTYYENDILSESYLRDTKAIIDYLLGQRM